MKSVRINKDKLIKIVRENREAHVSEYLEVIDGYWEALQQAFQEHTDAILNHRTDMIAKGPDALTEWGRGPSNYMRDTPPKPELHVQEYDEVLEMLEMSEDEVIELDRDSFNNYVRDDWSWSRDFRLSASNYKAG